MKRIRQMMPQLNDGEYSRFKGFQFARLAVLVTIGAAISVFGIVDQVASGLGVIAALAFFNLSISVTFNAIGIRNQWSFRRLIFWTLIVDVTAVTFGEYLIGGLNAVLGMPIYMTIVGVTSAMQLAKRDVFIISLYCAGSFALMATGTQVGWFVEQPSLFGFEISEWWGVATSVSNAIALVTFALVATRLLSQISEMNATLEERIETALKDLKTKNRSLEQSSAHIELFARAVSHDLRNPVTAAREFVRNAAKDSDQDERKLWIDAAADALDNADSMLMGLRDVMRSSSGSVGGERVDMNSAASKVISEFSIRDLSAVRFVVDDNLGFVRIHNESVKHILRNLIANAISHNEKSGLVIEIGRAPSPRGELYYVKDNGVGIDKNLLPLVFKPFHRGPYAQKGGLGLGLSIVEAIVTNADGQVWCESAKDEGATFWFSLPAITDPV